MKPSSLIHLIWAGICIGLMVLGYQINKGSAEESNPAAFQQNEPHISKVEIASFPERSKSPKSSPSATTNPSPDRSRSPDRLASSNFNHASEGSPDNSPDLAKPLANRPNSISERSKTSTASNDSVDSVSGLTLTPEEIDSLVKNALKETNPIDRRLAFDKLLSSIDETTAIPMRAALARNKATGEHWRLFDYAWSAGTPGVIHTHLPNPADHYKIGYISNSLPGWAFSDPIGAAEYVNDYEPGPTQDQFYNRLVEGFADKDIGMATDFVSDMAANNHPQVPRYTQTIAREIYENGGIEAVQTWASSLPDGPIQSSANQFISERSPKKPE